MKATSVLWLSIAIHLSLNAQEIASNDVNTIHVSKYASKAIVEVSKMNVLYIGIENPVRITVPGYDEIRVKLTNGTLTGSESFYYIRESTQGIETMIIYDKAGKEIDRKLFRVKRFPDPYASLGNFKGGPIEKNVMLAYEGLTIMIDNFDFELFFIVTHFRMTVQCKGKDPIELDSNSNLFTPAMKEVIFRLRSGNVVYFEYINATGPDGTSRRLRPLSFIIL